MRLRSGPFLAAVLLSVGCNPPAPPAAPAPEASASTPPPSAPPVVDEFPPPQPPPPKPAATAQEKPIAVLGAVADVNDPQAHFRVPVGSSPVDGKADALVTLVIFGGYQDPFSRKLIATMRALQKEFGSELRVVWKDRPLPFHKNAQAALRLARAVRASGGDRKFWEAHASLMDPSNFLDEPSLVKVGQKFGLPRAKVLKILATPVPALDEDTALGDALLVQGTPTSYVNGRRLVGAQPEEKFAQTITEEMAVARSFLTSGTPRGEVYEAMQREAATSARQGEPTPPPARIGAGGAGAASKPPKGPQPEPPPAPQEAIEAQHLLVAFKDARRASSSISRSREAARARAEQALAQLRKGADFDDIVRQFTDEPGGAERVGNLGRFRRGMMVKEFEQAAFALKPGETSGVIETPFGFHLIRRTK